MDGVQSFGEKRAFWRTIGQLRRSGVRGSNEKSLLLLGLIACEFTRRIRGIEQYGGESGSQSSLKDQAFSTFLDQNPPFELPPENGISPSTKACPVQWTVIDYSATKRLAKGKLHTRARIHSLKGEFAERPYHSAIGSNRGGATPDSYGWLNKKFRGSLHEQGRACGAID
jgi:hypothetical protein